MISGKLKKLKMNSRNNIKEFINKPKINMDKL